VLVDLIARAIDLAPGGSPVVVRVSIDSARPNGAWLRFEVVSPTPGSVDRPPERTPDARAETGRPPRADHRDSVFGYSKRLVDLIGGEIGVTDADGRGTTFWFTVLLAWSRPRPTPRT
jgi:hypothetical protein